MLDVGGVVLKLKILTFYVGIWRCCLKLWFEVENLGVLCWVWGCGWKLNILTFYVGFGGVV